MKYRLRSVTGAGDASQPLLRSLGLCLWMPDKPRDPLMYGKTTTGSTRQPPQQGHWEHFSHVADVGIRGIGRDIACAFEQAAVAMTAVICEPRDILPTKIVSIHCEAPNRELLLVDWLNAIVFEMSTRQMLFGTFSVRIDGNRLTGLACGEIIVPERHRPATEVKGATLSELSVQRTEDGLWRAQCIVDV